MQIDAMRAVLAQVAYKGWEFRIEEIRPCLLSGAGCRMSGQSAYLQVRFEAEGEQWSGRKWLLSQHMTESELVQTALKAVLTAEEHEARERFTYKERAVFGPHLHLEALIEACDRGELDARVANG